TRFAARRENLRRIYTGGHEAGGSLRPPLVGRSCSAGRQGARSPESTLERQIISRISAPGTQTDSSEICSLFRLAKSRTGGDVRLAAAELTIKTNSRLSCENICSK